MSEKSSIDQNMVQPQHQQLHDPDEINLLEYIYAIVKHKWLILGFTILGVVGGYIAGVGHLGGHGDHHHGRAANGLAVHVGDGADLVVDRHHADDGRLRRRHPAQPDEQLQRRAAGGIQYVAGGPLHRRKIAHRHTIGERFMGCDQRP